MTAAEDLGLFVAGLFLILAGILLWLGRDGRPR